MKWLHRWSAIVGASAIGVATASAAASEDAPRAMSLGQAAVLGAIEGLTEYLPVSSTGHLFVAERLMKLSSNAQEQAVCDSFGIAIQLGAILAVIGLYFGRIRCMTLGLLGRDPAGFRLLSRLLAAFLPAAVIGLVFKQRIEQCLFGPWPIALAWAVGGLAILGAGRVWRGRPSPIGEIEELSLRAALLIGLAQALALWPGVSRSLVTIAGGLVAGLRPRAAVEFSFLLGLVTLGAATTYEIVRHGRDMVNLFGWAAPLLGLAVAFITAGASMRWMVRYLQTRSFAIFGWYRLAAAAVTASLILSGRL